MMRFQSGQRAKYHGLLNQGATCYLNSVLQVLFMTRKFRERVTRYTTNAGTEHIDTELSHLFSSLEENYTHTRRITDKLRIRNVHEQRDAAEHYEKILRLTSPGASQIFHGELINKNICQKCGTVTESAAGFWHLPLPLVNNNNEYSVEKGIEDFFRRSVISGDDQMYCEACDKKCDAVLECEVKHYPEVLVLLLKRFEMIYDGNSVRKVKINCPVKMSDTLQMEKIRYELYAFVEHFGNLQYGHYNAKIKSPDEGRWYIFDDLNVEESVYQHFQLDPTETSENVYLLFYQQQKGDVSVTHKARPDAWETLPGTVTSGNKYPYSCTEEQEEEENNATAATRAFSKGYGAKDKPGRSSLKRGTVSEESNPKEQHPKEAMSVKDKMNKKHEPSQEVPNKRFQEDTHAARNNSVFQNHSDIVVVEETSARIKRQRKDIGQSAHTKWQEPDVERNRSESHRASADFVENPSSSRPRLSDTEWNRRGEERREQTIHPGYQSDQSKVEQRRFSPQNDRGLGEPRRKDVQINPATHRPVRQSSSFSPSRSNRPMHGNVTGYSYKSGLQQTMRSDERSAELDRGRPAGRRSFQVSPHRQYQSQDYQLENFRAEIEGRDDGRTKNERRGTQNDHYKGSVGRQSRGIAPSGQSQAEKPRSHRTPQQCLESFEQKKTRSSPYGHSPSRGGDAADHKSKAKKSTNYSPQNESSRNHRYGSKKYEAEITLYSSDEEEHNMTLNTQETREYRTEVESKGLKTKKKSSWNKWFGCIPFKRKRSK